MRIFTHANVDRDNTFSICAAREFIRGASEAEVVFVNQRTWNAETEPGDLILDMSAGGRGWKGDKDEDGIVHSCFKYIVDHFAPREDREILRHLVAFVDMQDSRGEALKHLLPNLSREERMFVSEISISAVFFGIKAIHPGNDLYVVNVMADFFSGYLELKRRNLSDDERSNFLQTIEFFGDGKVALVIDSPEGFSGSSLFNRGVVAYVYENGNDKGVRRRNSSTVRMDHPRIRAVVESVGEEIGEGDGKWYPHPSGFLFSWGTRTGHASTPSKVNTRKLAQAVAEVLLSVPEELGENDDSEDI